MRENTLRPWLLAVSMALLTPCAGNAAGLGRLAVLSALGQPLNAEIELLSVQKGESVVARLAPVDIYQQANLQYNPALVGTRVTVEKRPNGQQFLKATTPRPINEPFVELVVELNSEHGRVTRQYTILLDPPGYGRGAAEVPPSAAATPIARAPLVAQEPAGAVAPPSGGVPDSTVSAPSAAPSRPPPLPADAAPARSPSRAAPSTAPALPSTAATANEYGPIKPGETLGRIARSIKPEGVTLEQTLIGLYRHNPDAFIKKNMNLVKSGKILRVPEANEFANIPQREAVQEVHVQVADFNALRGKLADSAPSAREEGSVTSGRIGARVAEPGATEPRDTVRLSKGEPPSGKAARTGSTADRVRALEEEAVAREKALAEANDRIAQLEKTINDMQRLVELKGSPAAATQKTDKSANAQPPAAGGAKAPPATAAVITPVTPKEAETAGTATAPGSAKSTVADSPKTTAADVQKASPRADSAKGPAPQPKETPASQVATAKTAAPPAVEPEQDFLETVMNEPLYLAAGGAAVLLGGLGFVMARRRRSRDNEIKDDDDLIKIPPTLASSAPAAVAAAGATSAAVAPKAGTEPTPAPAPSAVEPAASAPVAAATTSTRAEGDDNDLDFNDETDGPEAVASRASGVVAAPTAALEPENEKAGEASEMSDFTAAEVEDKEPELPVHDFGFDTAPVRPSAPDLRVAQELDMDVKRPAQADDKPPEPLVHDFGFETEPLSHTPPTAMPLQSTTLAEAGSSKPDLSAVDFNLDPLPAIDASVDTMMGEQVASPSDVPLEEFKLDDLDLNFGREPVAAGAAKDDHWYDVQQKFDLAKAYEEMGDKDGAREILQEVVKEGDSEQQAQAKQLLGALS